MEKVLDKYSFYKKVAFFDKKSDGLKVVVTKINKCFFSWRYGCIITYVRGRDGILYTSKVIKFFFS
jgi:hypothetical protein